MFASRRLTALIALLVAAPLALYAATAPAAESTPVLLSADDLRYDDKGQTAIASGNVEVIYGKRMVLADRLTYDKTKDVLVAEGNVRLLDEQDTVTFADKMELTADLRDGFGEHLSMLMADNARIIAASGSREDGRVSTLNQAVYSPCNLCADDPRKPPLWQLKAARVEHDAVMKDITYHDAWMEMGGVPVFYTPYFSHPDPSVTQRSGFLAPRYGSKTDLGMFLRSYYYWGIDPEQDLTLEAMLTSRRGLLVGADWRKRFENGAINLSGSFTETDRTEGTGPAETLRPDELRGHIFGDGRWDINETWRAGFTLARTTDKSFLRQYDYSEADILQSNLYLEGFWERAYADMRVIDFQDLRPGITQETPAVLPQFSYAAQGAPGGFWGGRWAIEADALDLVRNSGADSRRLSIAGNWQRRLAADMGLVAQFDLDAAGEMYFTDDQPFPADDSAVTGRFLPQATMALSYPMARAYEGFTHMIEPIAAMTIAPNLPDSNDIPNEDSRDLEFDATNLFDDNRFPGLDQRESGTRVSYGIRSEITGDNGGYGQVFFGQSYRFHRDNDLPTNSGLEDNFSDFVGRVQLSPAEWLDLDYRLRLDHADLGPHRHELEVSAGVPAFRVDATYLYGEDLAGPTVQDRQQIAFGVTSQLTDNWSIAAFHRRDIDSVNDGPLESRLGFQYDDECLTFSVNGRRDSTERDGISSGTSIYFALDFKTLGSVKSPNLHQGAD